MGTRLSRTCLNGGILLIVVCCTSLPAAEPVLFPRIDGPAWTVAGDPDLGKWTAARQQPVDFGIWRAGDGTWQLWSCIRGTRCGGNTRLFYRWEGKKLTEKDWKPMGIAMTADEKYGEASGGLQAPHVIRIGGVYQMFYGNWHGICLARSPHGKKFDRVFQRGNNTQMFTEDTPQVRANTRDAMVLAIGDTYYCYYTAYPHRKGAVYCRTSRDLQKWSESKIVAYGGRAGTGPGSAECPHVVYRHGWCYLFRTQRYGRDGRTSVYRSKDPMDFGVEDDRFFVGTLPVAAPEIIRDGDRDYIASLLPSLKGIRVARLEWAPRADPR